jgi:hypothetical protein
MATRDRVPVRADHVGCAGHVSAGIAIEVSAGIAIERGRTVKRTALPRQVWRAQAGTVMVDTRSGLHRVRQCGRKAHLPAEPGFTRRVLY